MSDFLAETEVGPWLGTTQTCRTCERPSLSLQDGECPGCQEGAEEKAERVKRANADAARRGHQQTALYLRRCGFQAEAEYFEHRGMAK